VHAYAWSRTRNRGWAVAQSPKKLTTVTLETLKKRGYVLKLEHYLKVSTQLNECPDSYRDGVRDAPHHLQAVRPSTRLGSVYD
jgi:hypothetical protein